jgi:hypothetical protein
VATQDDGWLTKPVTTRGYRSRRRGAELVTRGKLRRVGHHGKGERASVVVSRCSHQHTKNQRERTGNVVNPMTGCRVQQTCKKPVGADRRSREKRQGRPARESLRAHADAETSSEVVAGEDDRLSYRWRGDLWEPHERKSGRLRRYEQASAISKRRSRKDRVDRQSVFEGGMKVTRAVQTGFHRPRRVAGSGRLEGHHLRM